MNDKPNSRNPFAAPAAADRERRILWARRSLRVISPALAALLLVPMAAQATSSDPPGTTTTTQVTTTAPSDLSTKVYTVFNAVAGETRSTSGTAEASTNVLTVKAVSVQSTYGDIPVTYSVEVTGLKAGDTAAGVTAGLRITGPEPDADSGVYAIRPSGLAVPSGYSGVSYVNGEHVIVQAPLQVRVKDVETVYGNTPQFDVRYYGLRNGDTAPAHVAAPSAVAVGTDTTVPADASINAGSYDVFGQAWDSNYDIASAPGNWTVHKAPLNITVDSVTKTWGDRWSPYHTDVRGLVNGDTRSDLTTVGVHGPGGTPDAGRYQLTLSGGTSPNYETRYDAGRLQVDPRHVTVAVDNKTRVYGSANPAFTATVTGMPEGMTLLTSFEPVPSDLPVGTWKIKYQRPDDHNLVIDVLAGALTTTPAPLTIAASSRTIASGTVPSDLSWRSTGWVYDHTESRLVARPTCQASVGGAAVSASTKPGIYPEAITCSGAQAPADYAISYRPGELRINPLMTLQATGLPTGTTPRATVDGQQVTLPRAGVEVPFASRHAYSFPGVVVDANNHLRITTAAAFNGEVRDNVSVTATYSTMGKLISDLVTAGKIKSVTGRQLANAWVPAEQGVVSDFQPLAGVRDFAEQVKLELTGEVAATLLAHAQVVFTYAGGEGSL